MSRIGKLPISLPKEIKAVVEGSVITFTKGNINKTLDTRELVNVAVEENQVVFSPKNLEREGRAFWGTFRALAGNIVTGLTSGFEKKLEINGVGYKAALKGNVLELALGYSHPINFEIPQGIEIGVEKNVVTIKGDDKQKVGQVAAIIRGFRPPEPYKGKGVKYSDETIIRKAGKTSKK